MTSRAGHRDGPYVRLHWSLLPDFDADNLSAIEVGVYVAALLASASSGGDGIFSLRAAARGVTGPVARRALVRLSELGYVAQVDLHTWRIVGFDGDQMTEAAWAEKRAKAAKRQRVRRAMTEARKRAFDDAS